MDGILELLILSGSLLVALVGLLLIPFGLPGNWLIALAGLSAPLAFDLSWWPFAVLVGAATVVEVADTLLAARFAKAGGAGRSGMIGAFIGGFIGAIFLTALIPIPVVGTLLGAAIGAFAGAVAFEVIFAGRPIKELFGVGFAAFIGSLLGKGLKLVVGIFQVVWLGMILLG